jgi:hypothetical protein
MPTEAMTPAFKSITEYAHRPPQHRRQTAVWFRVSFSRQVVSSVSRT